MTTPQTLDTLYFWNWTWMGLGISALALLSMVVTFALLIRLRTGVRSLLRRFAAETSPVVMPVQRLADTTLTLFLGVLSVQLVLPFVDEPPLLGRLIEMAFIVVASIQGAIWIRELAIYFLERQAQGRSDDETVLASAMGIVGWLLNLVIWSFAALIILSNLGVNVTALIAGLGIGGIAIGLAAQGIMADLFAALSILFDRPFVKGDFVVIGNTMGEVEEIGLKTTRIRALSGEQIVVANAALLARDVHNFRRMSERRINFKIRLDYATKVDQVSQVPDLLRQAAMAEPGIRFDRAHFTGFTDAGLEFEVVYYILSRDYRAFMDTHQQILLRIMRMLDDRGVELAVPARLPPQYPSSAANNA
ncbi:MAG TPA: mechanosensitive ion channel protein MscS [Alphaproteobacteria bacterium]|nr:mechanosensitive ion channel protein MscS [Alphaproteobacteria bacterium]